MNDIAIIGISGRFPEGAHISAFRQNLVEGRDSVRPFSFERKSHTSLDLEKEFKDIAFLEEVDRFDYKFFQVSRNEAEFMDPHQRVILEVVYDAIENSGYPASHFHGSNTAVFIGDTDQEYYKLADRFDPTILTGNTSATTAGRIARFFNLRGNALMLDTACSSSLVAVHMACRELVSGDADYALACGVRFILFPEEKQVNTDLGIMAADGKTKSFSAKADGSGAGEAVGCVLLKPLEKALADKDLIYAVIKGSAVNQDAQLSGSLTAPSAQAQSEVIRKAWERAGIDPATVSYIETHGSGTKLGDPIEITGLDQAFRGVTDQKQFCAVSSVKTNIGHTGGSAGISGLIKAVLSLYYRELYPSLHFDTPNPFIDFKNSVAYVNTAYKAWNPEKGIRRAGVSSFGLSGTNCHVVLEEAPAREQVTREPTPALFTFSAKSKESLAAYLADFRNFLDSSEALPQDIAYTLNCGRDHYSWRYAIPVKGNEDGMRKLENPVITNPGLAAKKLLFLFSGDGVITDQLIGAFSTTYPVFRQAYSECLQHGREMTVDFRRFSFQYSYYRLLENWGIQSDNLLGIGVGDAVVGTLLGEISLPEAIARINELVESQVSGIEERLRALVERETAQEKVIFIEMGTAGLLSSSLEKLAIPSKEELYSVITLGPDSGDMSEVLQALYMEQYPLDWKAIYSGEKCERILLPNYCFEKSRCWLKEPLTGKTAPGEREDKNEESSLVMPEVSEFDRNLIVHLISEHWTPTEQKIAAIWIEVLKLDNLGLEDDFFRLGGHSLLATRVISRIEQEFSIRLVFKDIFTFATVRALAAGVDKLLADGQETLRSEIAPAPELELYPLSHAQKRLWLIHERSEGNNTAYNLPAALEIRGEIDPVKLQESFGKLIQRHESLRTIFEERNGLPVQKIHSQVEFTVETYAARKDELKQVIQQFVRPFDLRHAPLLRVCLVSFSASDHVLLFDMHHIISDGVSLGIITKEFILLYEGADLKKPELQYKDYAVWQQDLLSPENAKPLEDYWLGRFQTPVPALELPLDKPRPSVRDFEGSKLQFTLEADVLGKLKNFGQETGATLYMTLLAVYNVLLAKYSGQEDIVVGSPIAGRNREALAPIVGMFVNTLAMRNMPSGDKSFRVFMEEVRENCIKAYGHQDYPLEMIIERLNTENQERENPLFNTLFVLQNLETPEVSLEGLTVRGLELETQTAQFDLTLEINEYPDHLLVNLLYSTSLFEADSMRLMKERFLALLNEILSDPGKTIRELDFNLVSETDCDLKMDFDLNF